MKFEWRKQEKELYLPKEKPMEIKVPKQKFYTLSGQGDPNEQQFSEEVSALYAMAYGIRMSVKKGLIGKEPFEYTVYPLEGVWTLSDEAVAAGRAFDKADLVYKIMIRQPDFITEEMALANLEQVAKKKPNSNNQNINFETIEEGNCVQMLHVGPYSEEGKTFEVMKRYCEEHQLSRKTFAHREIYLSDVRKIAPEKMKTVLRYSVKSLV
ncbi:GyrI-like domain-containing protein [Enterococcus crotali]|uniref:GyrI-like domain-containing protein n=1 Tax=Enterococcus crotali TaxID=1453587 RepID=UPI000471C9B4|nr:GyrI-like domain-containing protein [Enterococcus crotali]